MHGGMPRRMKAHVSTMLTDKRLEYCTAGAPLQESGATKWMMQADKHGISGAFRLDNTGPARPIASPGRSESYSGKARASARVSMFDI